jgi:hypothetical protein
MSLVSMFLSALPVQTSFRPFVAHCRYESTGGKDERTNYDKAK